VAAEPRVRRAYSLVCFWRGRDLVVQNYLSKRLTALPPELLPALGTLDAYEDGTAAAARLGLGASAGPLIAQLLEQDVLVAEGSPLAERDERLERSWRWGPEARFLHFSTQGIRFEYDAEAEERRLTRQRELEPPPSPYKELAGAGSPLPDTLTRDGAMWEALRRRRTLRRFCRQPISLDEFAAVLQWTWGKTHELEGPLLGRSVLKTSPSGGARHTIEVYPLVLRVDGVPSGVYHYSVARNDLELLRAGEFEHLAVDLCGAQEWVQDAAVVFFMTSIIERSAWKYPHAHAYRVLHIDAGHLGQTFHLVCTELGLAPFTTTATDATGIEQALGIDGISEIALYTAATGYPAPR
jgi:SagB-type dehydrogenase family enzyme